MELRHGPARGGRQFTVSKIYRANLHFLFRVGTEANDMVNCVEGLTYQPALLLQQGVELQVKLGQDRCEPVSKSSLHGSRRASEECSAVRHHSSANVEGQRRAKRVRCTALLGCMVTTYERRR